MKKQIYKINEAGYLLFGEDLFIEPDRFDDEERPVYEIPGGYVETPLPTNGEGQQLPFYCPKWTGEEWVEGKTQVEFEEDEYLQSLIPSAEEVIHAEFEIILLNLLMEVELL